MADTTTLNPFSTKPKEQKPDPLGGRVGFLDEFGSELVPDPQRLATDGGQFVKEGFRGIAELLTKDIAGVEDQQERGKLAIGTQNQTEIGNFSNPNKTDMELIKEQRAAINEATRIVQQSKAKTELENAVRLQIAGMSDEEKAKEGHYQAGYRGESLNSIYNLMDIFFRKVRGALEELGNRTKKPIEILNRRASTKAAVSGANDLLLNASAQEGQSMTSSSSAVRGAG